MLITMLNPMEIMKFMLKAAGIFPYNKTEPI